jgi:hypothetical protein
MRGGLRDFASDEIGSRVSSLLRGFHHFGESAVTVLVGGCAARR